MITALVLVEISVREMAILLIVLVKPSIAGRVVPPVNPTKLQLSIVSAVSVFVAAMAAARVVAVLEKARFEMPILLLPLAWNN